MQIIPAIDLKDNKCVRLSKGKDSSSVIYNEDAFKFDKEKTLDISKANTPYLAQRIIKYLNEKGLNKISEKSRHKIKEYLFNVLCKNWPSYMLSLKLLYLLR